MKTIYLFMYRMRGNRSIDTMPVYAASLPEATAKFRAAMAANGCERDKYEIIRHREIAESDIRWYVANHKEIVQRLSPDDRLALLQDRKARQQTELGRIDGNVTRMLGQLQST